MFHFAYKKDHGILANYWLCFILFISWTIIFMPNNVSALPCLQADISPVNVSVLSCLQAGRWNFGQLMSLLYIVDKMDYGTLAS